MIFFSLKHMHMGICVDFPGEKSTKDYLWTQNLNSLPLLRSNSPSSNCTKVKTYFVTHKETRLRVLKMSNMSPISHMCFCTHMFMCNTANKNKIYLRILKQLQPFRFTMVIEYVETYWICPIDGLIARRRYALQSTILFHYHWRFACLSPQSTVVPTKHKVITPVESLRFFSSALVLIIYTYMCNLLDLMNRLTLHLCKLPWVKHQITKAYDFVHSCAYQPWQKTFHIFCCYGERKFKVL